MCLSEALSLNFLRQCGHSTVLNLVVRVTTSSYFFTNPAKVLTSCAGSILTSWAGGFLWKMGVFLESRASSLGLSSTSDWMLEDLTTLRIGGGYSPCPSSRHFMELILTTASYLVVRPLSPASLGDLSVGGRGRFIMFWHLGMWMAATFGANRLWQYLHSTYSGCSNGTCSGCFPSPCVN